VFPLKYRSKLPATDHGFLEASTDASRFEWPDTANIGIAAAMSGLVVIDIDPRDGGFQTFDELVKRLGELPPGPASETGGEAEDPGTGRRGRHLLFKHPGGEVRGKLGLGKREREGVDLKSNGYITAPPSVHPDTGRRYRWLPGASPDDIEVPELPAAWIAAVRRAPAPAPAPPPPPPPRPSSTGIDVVERARRYVARMPPAISGSGGHDATFDAALVAVKGFALDDADAWSVLVDFNGRCEPPWSERELRHKLDSAKGSSLPAGYLRDAPLPDRGGPPPAWVYELPDEPPWPDEPPPPDDAPTAAAEPTAPTVSDEPAASTPTASEGAPAGGTPERGWIVDAAAWLAVEESDAEVWAVEGLLPRAAPSLITGQPKCGKTTLAVDLALSLALGEPAVGGVFANGFGRPARVWLAATEDSQAHIVKLTRQLLAGRGVAVDDPRFLANFTAWSPRAPITLPADFPALAASLKAARVEVAFIDSFAATFSLDENSTADASRFAASWAAACRSSGCAIVLLHHAAKPAHGKGAQRDVVSAVRGSSALAAAARAITQVSLTRDGTTRLDTRGNMGPATAHRVVLHRDDASARYALPEGGGHEESEDRARARQLRGEGLSVRAISDEIGVPRSTVARWAKGDAGGVPRDCPI
jgi:hypothetical protein